MNDHIFGKKNGRWFMVCHRSPIWKTVKSKRGWPEYTEFRIAEFSGKEVMQAKGYLRMNLYNRIQEPFYCPYCIAAIQDRAEKENIRKPDFTDAIVDLPPSIPEDMIETRTTEEILKAMGQSPARFQASLAAGRVPF